MGSCAWGVVEGGGTYGWGSYGRGVGSSGWGWLWVGVLTGGWVDLVKNPEHIELNLRISRKCCFGAILLSKLVYWGSGLVKFKKPWTMEKYCSVILVSGMWTKAILWDAMLYWKVARQRIEKITRNQKKPLFPDPGWPKMAQDGLLQDACASWNLESPELATGPTWTLLESTSEDIDRIRKHLRSWPCFQIRVGGWVDI